MTELPIRRGELVQSPGTEGWTIYISETDSLHVLNDSARAIWDLCDGKTSAEEMAKAISELTGISSEQAQHDVRTTLNQLDRLGLATLE